MKTPSEHCRILVSRAVDPCKCPRNDTIMSRKIQKTPKQNSVRQIRGFGDVLSTDTGTGTTPTSSHPRVLTSATQYLVSKSVSGYRLDRNPRVQARWVQQIQNCLFFPKYSTNRPSKSSCQIQQNKKICRKR